MNISIQNLKLQSESKWIAELEAGKTKLKSEILFRNDDDLQLFQIVEHAFKDMLALNGLEGIFSRHLFSFIETHHPELPWDLGEHDTEVIERVLKFYKIWKN